MQLQLHTLSKTSTERGSSRCKNKNLTEGGCTCSKCQKKDGHALYVVAKGMASLDPKPMMRFPLNHIAPLYSKKFRVCGNFPHFWKISQLLQKILHFSAKISDEFLGIRSDFLISSLFSPKRYISAVSENLFIISLPVFQNSPTHFAEFACF